MALRVRVRRREGDRRFRRIEPEQLARERKAALFALLRSFLIDTLLILARANTTTSWGLAEAAVCRRAEALRPSNHHSNTIGRDTLSAWWEAGLSPCLAGRRTEVLASDVCVNVAAVVTFATDDEPVAQVSVIFRSGSTPSPLHTRSSCQRPRILLTSHIVGSTPSSSSGDPSAHVVIIVGATMLPSCRRHLGLLTGHHSPTSSAGMRCWAAAGAVEARSASAAMVMTVASVPVIGQPPTAQATGMATRP